MMQLTANQTAAFRPQTVSRKAAGARLVVRAFQVMQRSGHGCLSPISVAEAVCVLQEQRRSPAQHLLAGIAAGSLLLSPVAGNECMRNAAVTLDLLKAGWTSTVSLRSAGPAVADVLPQKVNKQGSSAPTPSHCKSCLAQAIQQLPETCSC